MEFLIRMKPRAPFDLASTVYSHGFHQVPPFDWDADARMLRIAVRPSVVDPAVLAGQATLGCSPLLVSICQTGPREPRLKIVVSGRRRARGDLLRTFIRALVVRVLDLERDLGPFHDVCSRHEPLAWALENRAGRILHCPDVFSDVVVSICGTNTQWSQAVSSAHRLCEIAPRAGRCGPRCFPTASEILEAGAGHLIDNARVGYRHKTILEFCEMVESGRVDLGLPLDPCVSGDDLRQWFRSLPGIGPVTARYLATIHGRADELAVDSLVLRYIGDKYHGGRKPSVKSVEKRYAPFGEHRALAYWFEFLGDVDPVTWRGWDRDGQ